MTTATTTTVSSSSRRAIVLLLIVITAAIHVSRAMVDPEISTLFALNAIGYLVLGALLYAPVPALEARRSLIRYVLIAYTITTIVLFFLWGAMSGDWPVIGFVDKAAEIALVVVLWLDRKA
jgi:hypothetical protein